MNITEKYRPKELDELVGQDQIVDILENQGDDPPSSYLFFGPSGVGKTTLARIMADKFDANGMDLIEIDAASNSGVDDMKALVNRQWTHPMEGLSRMFIIDECQRLSKNAWDALLKAVEDPPRGNYWIFCTTEVSKVPRTIRTRCVELKFRDVVYSKIKELLKKVEEKEEYKISDENRDRIISSSGGSPRKALVLLEQCANLDEEDLKFFLNDESTSASGYELAKLMSKKSFDFGEAVDILAEMKTESPEGIRQTVRAYFTTMALRSKSPYALGVLKEFEVPSVEQNGITDILLRVARIEKWK